MNIKELADIGATAAHSAQMQTDGTMAVYMDPKLNKDESARQAFAQAVKDAVEKPLRDELTVMGARIAEVEKPNHQHYSLELAQYIVEVAKRLVTKPDSLPTTKTIPLDINDIRATDEFMAKGGTVIEVASYWDDRIVDLPYSDTPTYKHLAANYLRRQHGSTEWKPCTKETK